MNHYVDRVMEELMNRLGLPIPAFTGAPWWTTNSTENEVKKEQVNGCDQTTHRLDYEPSQDFPAAKRQKQICEEDQDNNDENK